MNLSELTYGVSKKGVDEYYEKLHTEAFKKAEEAVKDYDALFTTLKTGWIGKAEEDYEKEVKQAAKKVEDELEKVDKIVKEVVYKIKDEMFKQDKVITDETIKFSIKQ